MIYFDINPKLYDGFRYQIPFTTPIHWSMVSWISEDIENRQWRGGVYKNDQHLKYIELKNESDLTYFMLRWA